MYIVHAAVFFPLGSLCLSMVLCAAPQTMLLLLFVCCLCVAADTSKG